MSNLYRKIVYCPFCGKRIWGEGWNPKTQERFYSHVKGKKCYLEIGIKVSVCAKESE